jgi:site-specific DNA-methyltransferase (adenine-specific)
MFRDDRTSTPQRKYQQTGTQKSYPTFAGDNRDQVGWAFWCQQWLTLARQAAKPGAVFGIFTDWRQLPLLSHCIQASGWLLRGILVWDKTEAARPVYGRFRAQAEYILWGSNGPMAINNGAPTYAGVYREPVRSHEKYHVTGKPVGLLQHWLQLTPPGAVVLDPFAGSGSTGVAVMRAGGARRAILVEHERAYCQITWQRLTQEEEHGKKAFP